ncbi:hypothetical protein [Dactylosporangium sp. CA-092794]|uniref:hypothetical protein n=1 Tax=Dactylosporangium sp. CA-092794 TaxID=3239929 RepID=UPI003D8C65C0
MASPKWRTAVIVTLMAVSGAVAVVLGLSSPSVGTVTVTNPDGSLVGQAHTAYSPWWFVWQAALFAVVLLAIVSTVAYLNHRFALTRQLLRIMAVIGLVAAVVPGLLAFTAYQLARDGGD